MKVDMNEWTKNLLIKNYWLSSSSTHSVFGFHHHWHNHFYVSKYEMTKNLQWSYTEAKPLHILWLSVDFGLYSVQMLCDAVLCRCRRRYCFLLGVKLFRVESTSRSVSLILLRWLLRVVFCVQKEWRLLLLCDYLRQCYV